MEASTASPSYFLTHRGEAYIGLNEGNGMEDELTETLLSVQALTALGRPATKTTLRERLEGIASASAWNWTGMSPRLKALYTTWALGVGGMVAEGVKRRFLVERGEG